MIYARLRASASVAALTLSLAAAAQAEVPAVVTDLPVTHSLTAMVMGELGAPVLLLDRGANAHDFALRPSQARAVAGAGLVVWMGEAMTPWMGRAVAGLAPAAQLELLEVDGLHLHTFPETAPETALSADDDDDHGHDDHDGHGGHGHRHAYSHDHHQGDADPHAWLDPQNAAVWVGAIAARLAEVDPDNAATYQANAETARASLAALTDEVRAILQPVGDAGIVVHHDAYSYFAEAFGVNVAGSIADGHAAAPGAARLSAIRATLAQTGVTCLFPEANHPASYGELVVEGTGIRLGAPLDPEGVMLEPGADLYAALMRGLAQSIADCVTAD